MTQTKKGGREKAPRKRGVEDAAADPDRGSTSASVEGGSGSGSGTDTGQADQERLLLRVHGRVQGVGYRATAYERAVEIGVTGWVRNLDNGVVELLAEGSPDQLDRLLLWCRKGPRLARVDEVDIWRTPATGEFPTFRIRS